MVNPFPKLECVSVKIQDCLLFRWPLFKGMKSFVLIKPSLSGLDACCVDHESKRIQTLEKYPKTYTFSLDDAVVHAGDSEYVSNLLLLLNIRNSAKRFVHVLSFGVSGSGKTHTMVGAKTGLIFQYCAMFDRVDIRVLEVYKNECRILAETSSVDDLYEVLQTRKSAQFVSHTSSRSHLIVEVRDRSLRNPRVTSFIDTAGFERPDDERDRQETIHINQDMLAVKECIRSITAGKAHVPFRRRVITRYMFENATNKNYDVTCIGFVNPHHTALDKKSQKTCLASVNNTLEYMVSLNNSIKVARMSTSSRPVSLASSPKKCQRPVSQPSQRGRSRPTPMLNLRRSSWSHGRPATPPPSLIGGHEPPRPPGTLKPPETLKRINSDHTSVHAPSTPPAPPSTPPSSRFIGRYIGQNKRLIRQLRSARTVKRCLHIVNALAILSVHMQGMLIESGIQDDVEGRGGGMCD